MELHSHDRLRSVDGHNHLACSPAHIEASFEHIPADLLAHQLRGAAACETEALLDFASREGFPLDVASIECPVRIVRGTDDRVVEWPTAAERYRNEFAHADWVVLDGVGHCPQLDVPR